MLFAYDPGPVHDPVEKRFASKWMDSDIYIVMICYFPIFEAINQRGFQNVKPCSARVLAFAVALNYHRKKQKADWQDS